MTTTRTAQSPQSTMQVPSSDGKRMYTITLPRDPSLPAYCSCPGWRYAKLPPALRTCRHLRQVAGRFGN